jgi:hypothetical protein
LGVVEHLGAGMMDMKPPLSPKLGSEPTEPGASDAAPADPFADFYTKFMSGDAAQAKDAFQGMMSTCEPAEPEGDEPKPSLLSGFTGK